MGLTCSLLGHRFGDPVVEQDREDRGREAVTVTREVVVCERCGERRIRSESTEVAAVAEDSDDHGGTEASENTATETEPDTDSEAEAGDGAASGPEAVSGEPAARADGDATGVEAVSGEPAAGEEPDLAAPEGEPADEGAEILTEESETEERGFGEWPEAPDTAPGPADEPDSEPDAEGEGATGTTTESGSERAASAGAGPDSGTEEFEEAAGADDGPVRLVCSDCGFSVGATGSPLRAGDACPDCSAAYLAERNE